MIIQHTQTKKVSSWVNTCEYIVLHHTWWDVTTPDINHVNYLSTNKAQVSCHYVIWKDWKIYQIADDKKITRHAWISQRDWKTDLNRYSIGIEVVSDWKTFTLEQKANVRRLVDHLLKKHNLKSDRIIRHLDIAPKRKRDIWDSFRAPFKTFKEYQESYNTLPKLPLLSEWIRNGERPNEPATRLEVATMLDRLYQLLNK